MWKTVIIGVDRLEKFLNDRHITKFNAIYFKTYPRGIREVVTVLYCVEDEPEAETKEVIYLK